jgi:hypothetical protein
MRLVLIVITRGRRRTRMGLRECYIPKRLRWVEGGEVVKRGECPFVSFETGVKAGRMKGGLIVR